MPNRIIKETICTSEQINNLTLFAEITFYRLMVVVDDFGRMDGRVPILKSRLYPLKDVRVSQLEDALRELSSEELVECYEVDGRPFVRLTGWERHQQKRASKSKYPAPSCNNQISKGGDCDGLISIDINCNQPKSNSLVIENRESRIVDDLRARASNGGCQLSEAEMDEMRNRQVMMDQCLVKLAEIGLTTQSDRQKCELRFADYSAEWMLEALERTSNAPVSARRWQYIDKILASWKALGHIDHDSKPDRNGLSDFQRKKKAFENKKAALIRAGKHKEASELTMSDMEVTA